VLVEGYFLTVFREFEPQNVVGHRVDPQKALPYVTTRVLSILREIPCTGCFSRRVRGKNKNKKERPYISRILPGAPLRLIGTNFRFLVHLVDLINFAKFYRNRLRGLDSMSGQSLDWIAIWPLTLCDCELLLIALLGYAICTPRRYRLLFYKCGVLLLIIRYI